MPFCIPLSARMQKQITFYSLALLSVAGALILELLIGPHASATLGPMFLVAAIALTSWHGGFVPGLIAVVCAGLLVDFFWVSPRYTFQVDATEIPWFITFICSSLVGMVVSVQRKRHEDQIKHARDELELRVAERTSALETSISDHQKAEEESRRAQEELARVVRLTTMGELAASIAHEINQPLAAIISNAGACLRWLDGTTPNLAEAQAAAQRIVRDGNRAADVVKTVRAMVTKSAPHIVPIHINSAIADVLGLIDREIKRRGIHVHRQLAPDLPKVSADCVQLQQVILNLLMNAIDAMDSTAAAERNLRIETTLDDQDFITVTVQDSGEGISPQIVERIFDAFFTTRSQGMGMGLAICRSIIEGHGGRLWVDSPAQGGTAFYFSLPIASTREVP